LPDRELVIAARAGQAWAGEALYRRYRAMAYGVASRFARGHDRDDVIQDAFLRALGSLDQIQHPDLFANWLASLVVYTAVQRARSRRRRARLDDRARISIEYLSARPAAPEVGAELKAIYRRIDKLPGEARIAFVLRRVEGMSIQEVAGRLGRSVATAKRRLAQAEKLFRRRLRAAADAEAAEAAA
jgi:RNA polymerase sigma-70 factor (ECF subfamily)